MHSNYLLFWKQYYARRNNSSRTILLQMATVQPENHCVPDNITLLIASYVKRSKRRSVRPAKLRDDVPLKPPKQVIFPQSCD